MKYTRKKRLISLISILLCVLLCLSSCHSTPPDGEEGYGFDTENAENFVMVGTEAFQSLLPKDVTRLVFSDCAVPKDAVVTDFSSNASTGVLGWRAESAYIISTRVEGKKVIFNPESAGLFANLASLEAVEFGAVDTSRVQDFMRFFYNCTALGAVDISCFSFESAIRTRSMFMNCVSLSSVTLAGVDTSTLRDTAFMFSGTGKLEAIDLSSCDLSAVICTTAMFQNTGAKSILLPDTLSVLGSFFLNHATRYEGESFTLPASAKELSGAHLFYNMGSEKFTAFIVPEGNEHFKTVEGVLYSADGTRLLAVPKGKAFENGVFEIAEGVTLMGELCLSRNTHIQTLLLPNSYKVTVYAAQNHKDFADVSGSGNKNTGNSLNLATYLFTDVKAFAVKEDNPLYVAKDGVLYEKDEEGNALSLVAVPVGYEGVLSIPEGVESIKGEALWVVANATFDGLTEIRIPASLTDIEAGQLEKINALGVTVTVAEGNAVYTVTNGLLTVKNQ